MKAMIRRLWKDEEGATMVEYGLIVVVVALVAVVGATTLGTDLSALFTRIGGQVNP